MIHLPCSTWWVTVVLKNELSYDLALLKGRRRYGLPSLDFSIPWSSSAGSWDLSVQDRGTDFLGLALKLYRHILPSWSAPLFLAKSSGYCDPPPFPSLQACMMTITLLPYTVSNGHHPALLTEHICVTVLRNVALASRPGLQTMEERLQGTSSWGWVESLGPLEAKAMRVPLRLFASTCLSPEPLLISMSTSI